MNPRIQVDYTRGPLVESHHFVHAFWMDENGQVMRSWGDPDRVVCPRSALKPLQAIPLAMSGAYQNSPDAPKALSIACASHWGQDRHVNFVREWLPMLGKTENDLICGAEEPEGFARIQEIVQKKIPLGRAFNNCSGKHTGMIACCQKQGWDQAHYAAWDHPLQVMIRQVCTRLSGLDWDQAPYGIDGCGLPNYFVPMSAMGQAIRHFLNPDQTPYGPAMHALLSAWKAEPYMMGGTGDVASELAHLTRGRVLAKVGAQGNYIAMDFRQKRILVLKVEDGATKASDESLLALLSQAQSISDDELRALRRFVPGDVRNWAGEVVGQVRVHAESSQSL